LQAKNNKYLKSVHVEFTEKKLQCPFKDYEEIVDKCCAAWNDILKKDNFVKKLCSREWIELV